MAGRSKLADSNIDPVLNIFPPSPELRGCDRAGLFRGRDQPHRQRKHLDGLVTHLAYRHLRRLDFEIRFRRIGNHRGRLRRHLSGLRRRGHGRQRSVLRPELVAGLDLGYDQRSRPDRRPRRDVVPFHPRRAVPRRKAGQVPRDTPGMYYTVLFHPVGQLRTHTATFRTRTALTGPLARPHSAILCWCSTTPTRLRLR